MILCGWYGFIYAEDVGVEDRARGKVGSSTVGRVHVVGSTGAEVLYREYGRHGLYSPALQELAEAMTSDNCMIDATGLILAGWWFVRLMSTGGPGSVTHVIRRRD